MSMKVIFLLFLFHISLYGEETVTNSPSGTTAGTTNSQWIVNGNFTPDSDSLKATNGFGVRLDLTEDQKFFSDWQKPETPHYMPISIARRGVPIFTVLIFVNPSLGSDNR